MLNNFTSEKMSIKSKELSSLMKTMSRLFLDLLKQLELTQNVLVTIGKVHD